MKVKILANKNWTEDQTRICIQSKQRNLSNDYFFPTGLGCQNIWILGFDF